MQLHRLRMSWFVCSEALNYAASAPSLHIVFTDAI